jgi:hypothetical protein
MRSGQGPVVLLLVTARLKRCPSQPDRAAQKLARYLLRLSFSDIPKPRGIETATKSFAVAEWSCLIWDNGPMPSPKE